MLREKGFYETPGGAEAEHETKTEEEKQAEREEKATELALKGFSRVVRRKSESESKDTSLETVETEENGEDEPKATEETGDEEAEEEDDDYYGEEEDDYDYYSEEEEAHFGEERAEFDESKLTLWEIPLKKDLLKRYEFLAKIPHGIAVMGGVARSIAREVITGEREPIRDIDLVNILDENGQSRVSADVLDKLSREFMPDDYKFGHGVGNDTIENYFKTRDFTINQSLIMDGKLIVSDLAYSDFLENIVRPTYYEHSHSGDEISSRLFLKGLMLRGVIAQISESVPTVEDMEKPDYIRDFDLALFLNKAMSRGAQTARTFTRDLADWEVIGEDFTERPVALAKSLLGSIYGFEFRPADDERFTEIQECRDLGGFFPPREMTRFHATNPEIRRAIEEYEDWETRKMEEFGERQSGKYTQAEFDEINRVGAGYLEDF